MGCALPLFSSSKLDLGLLSDNAIVLSFRFSLSSCCFVNDTQSQLPLIEPLYVAGCSSQPFDLVFVLDGSESVGKDNFVHLQDFVRSTTVQFDINRDLTQVGLVVYSRWPVSVFELDSHASGSGVLKALRDASYLGGKASTGSALLHVHSHSLTVAKGARPGVNKAVVVLADGTGAEDAVVPAQKIRDDGVSVFAIGTGVVQRERLLRIAGSEGHIITVSSYEDLKDSVDELVRLLCAGEAQ